MDMILIDNGHGIETPGKRSPDGRLLEYKYTRQLAASLEAALRKAGLPSARLVPEEADVPLAERVRRANRYAASGGAVLVSLHCNAAGSGASWMKARGWGAYVSPNASGRSRNLATALAGEAAAAGLKLRQPMPGQKYWVQDLAICRDTRCPAVLTENLFQDNREDVDFLLSGAGREAIVGLHVRGLRKFLGA